MAVYKSAQKRAVPLGSRGPIPRSSLSSNDATPTRRPCLCSCDLIKPTQRLQRLLHSASPIASGSKSPESISLEQATELSGREASEVFFEELYLLVKLLPKYIQKTLLLQPRLSQLVEIVLDLGRLPVARFPGGDVRLAEVPISADCLRSAVDLVGDFGDDNRAGIDRTLHRISCMRNRDGAIVGLTCRVGRAISGCASLAADLAMEGRSLLILGRPGVGKTTAIREISRFLSDDCQKRVVIVDTSNEIGGDGDIPHQGVGTARRMQVARSDEQHRVMIEAVENHMPEVIVIDEIGTEAEALAARTIAQRGIQLIATAHGGHIDNLMNNPALLDLIGGISSVTLGDEEARRRGTRKTTRERSGPPTFDSAIEILERRKWRVYPNLAHAVDRMLLGYEPTAELREQDAAGLVQRKVARQFEFLVETEEEFLQQQRLDDAPSLPHTHPAQNLHGATHVLEEGSGTKQEAAGAEKTVAQPLFVHAIGLDQNKVVEALQAMGGQGERLILSQSLESADVVLAMRAQMKTGSWARDAAKAAGVPVYAVKNGSASHLLRALRTLLGLQPSAGSLFDSCSTHQEPVQYQNHVVSMTSARNEAEALEEVRQAVQKIVLPSNTPIELLPRAKDVVAKQAALAEGSYGLSTKSIGKGSQCCLQILPTCAVSPLPDSSDAAFP